MESERMRLEMERQKECELEMKLEMQKQQESEKLEHERREREAERQRAEREAERQSAEREKDRAIEMELMMEKAKLEMEHEFKMKQLEMSRAGSDDGEEVIEGEAGEDGERPVRVRAPTWEETLAGRTKRFGDTLRHVLPTMPTDVGQIPQFFRKYRANKILFDIYEVPADLRSKLLIPHLSERAKSLIGRLEVKSLDNYDEMKRFLLGEFKVTVMEYKTRFDKDSKRSDETHVLFASRLHNELVII